ncbi:MAG: NAD(P)H-dependent oxidoreductase [Candidatus Falkowbacteria bacterium]
MNIIEQLNWRYATKVFDASKKISATDFDELLEATRLAPSSYGLPLWKAFVVKNPELREKIAAAAHGQMQAVDAAELIVFVVPKKIDEKIIDDYLELVATTRLIQISTLADYKKMMLGAITSRSDDELKAWASKQACIALGFLLETAALKKIDACPMEGFNATKVNEILGLDEKGYESVLICPLGYRSESDPYVLARKVRFAKDEVFMEIK